jgi:uncharacterized protein
MTFKRGARLDPGQVTDRRGVGGRGGIAIGGGVGLVALLIFALLGGDPGQLGQLLEPGTGAGGPDSSALATDCETGEDANTRDECRILGYVNSVQAYWTGAFAAVGETYRETDTVLFTGSTSSACGTASAATGPFYCPRDQLIYLDADFFDVLRTRLGARGGSLAEGYVIAHEYGHYVQDLLGILSGGDRGSGADSRAVRIELQADCFAGAWAHNAASTGYLEPLTSAQIADALDAAAAVGDDRIQETTTGEVQPHTWTHGSSAQRQKWFTVGYEKGDPSFCDTLEGDL